MSEYDDDDNFSRQCLRLEKGKIASELSDGFDIVSLLPISEVRASILLVECSLKISFLKRGWGSSIFQSQNLIIAYAHVLKHGITLRQVIQLSLVWNFVHFALCLML